MFSANLVEIGLPDLEDNDEHFNSEVQYESMGTEERYVNRTARAYI